MTSERASRTALAALVLAVLAGPATAQSPEDPRLVFTTFAGYVGSGSLWQLNRQPAAVTGGAWDTLTLGRDFKPGFALGLGIQLFRSPHVGYALEIAFLGTTTESRCRPIGSYAFDSEHVNRQACENIQGTSQRTNAVAVQGGVIWRARTQGAVQPYLRAAAGFGILGGSFVETRGTVALSGVIDTTGPPLVSRVFLDEKERTEFTWEATLAAGTTLEMAPGYNLRFELRDLIFSAPVVTGPANALDMVFPAVAQVGRKMVHLPTLSVGFDIVLERQRRRRY